MNLQDKMKSYEDEINQELDEGHEVVLMYNKELNNFYYGIRDAAGEQVAYIGSVMDDVCEGINDASSYLGDFEACEKAGGVYKQVVADVNGEIQDIEEAIKLAIQ